AETVASLGSLQFIDQTTNNIVGVELNMNHIRSAYSGNILTAVGQPIHVGRKILVWEIRIYNEKDKLICSSRCTLAVVNKPAA
ncbi:MAG: hotdog fold thioesterase, partial [Syntrophomonadaceae bacterium]|nr:hotdog fold thioesterase [Syntrophomonadaceae bacterium]